jgi:SAM-dependent methyltransferase
VADRADSDRWRLLEAEPSEREFLGDLASVLSRASAGSVLPPNRLREVRRVEVGGRVYYLKIFRRTQLKNLSRNLRTAPRGAGPRDAEREAGVAAALREAGVEAARPVAVGRRGPGSFYLCAELPGRSLRAEIASGRCTPATAAAAARFAGGLFRLGFALPDLSADHVFVLAGPRAGSFGVLDLHNGWLRRPGRPHARSARRALRRFARSVADLGVRRREALRFSVRFLRAAGFRARSRRRLLAALPPFDTHGRYDAPGRSRAYRERNPGRARREVALLARLWPGRAGDRVLDAPCGAGRLCGPLTDRHGAIWHGCDRSRAMLAEARGALGAEAPLAAGDAAALPFADGAFDGVVVFRFLHHLPPAEARAVIDEAARAARRFVVVSFFHPVSAHNLTRRLSEVLRGRARTRHALRPARLVRWLCDAGFRPLGFAAEARFRRDLWLGAFERV